jgi:DNA-cytosine methyltransferase
VTLTLVSLFDGIGGFPLAFERVGARTVATVEIDTAAAAISARHFPYAHQFSDVTEVSGDDLRAVGFVPDRGIITAGWPCQDLSLAGRREGLAGARSGLWWEVVRLLDETHARWFLGENVPGLLSSNNGRDMGAIVGALGDLGYGFAYRVLDAQHFGVPQRRRRVFFVGHLGEPWPAPAEVLFECESGDRDSAAGGKEGQGVTSGVGTGAGIASRSGGGLVPTVSSKWSKGTGGPSGDECQNLVLDDTHTHTHTRSRRFRAAGNAATGSTPNQQRAGTSSCREVVAALTADGVGTCGADDNQAQAGHLIPTILGGGVTHTLTHEGHDASEDGTGRGTPIVVQPLALRGRRGGG